MAWSSDGCPSDLHGVDAHDEAAIGVIGPFVEPAFDHQVQTGEAAPGERAHQRPNKGFEGQRMNQGHGGSDGGEGREGPDIPDQIGSEAGGERESMSVYITMCAETLKKKNQNKQK